MKYKERVTWSDGVSKIQRVPRDSYATEVSKFVLGLIAVALFITILTI